MSLCKYDILVFAWLIWIVRVACSKMPILAHLLRWWISQGFSDFPRKHWSDPRYTFISQGEKSLDKAAVSGHWQRSWWARNMEQVPHECDLSLQITSWPLFPGHSASYVGREDMVKCKSFHYYSHWSREFELCPSSTHYLTVPWLVLYSVPQLRCEWARL